MLNVAQIDLVLKKSSKLLNAADAYTEKKNYQVHVIRIFEEGKVFEILQKRLIMDFHVSKIQIAHFDSVLEWNTS